MLFNLGASKAPVEGSPDDDHLIGLVSWAIGCGGAYMGLPTVYTKVVPFLNWIDAAVKQVGANVVRVHGARLQGVRDQAGWCTHRVPAV